MNTDLDDLLLHAHERGEVVLYTPPDTFELIAATVLQTVEASAPTSSRCAGQIGQLR